MDIDDHTRTERRSSVLDAIPGIRAVALACQGAPGATLTYVLDAIAWACTAHQATGWSDLAYRFHWSGVRDQAGFLYAAYPGYPDDAQFDDVRPEHREPLIASVLACFEDIEGGESAFEADRPGITLTRAQLEAWVGQPLTDELVAEIDECIPNSSIPEAIGAIAGQFLPVEADGAPSCGRPVGHERAFPASTPGLEGGQRPPSTTEEAVSPSPACSAPPRGGHGVTRSEGSC